MKKLLSKIWRIFSNPRLILHKLYFLQDYLAFRRNYGSFLCKNPHLVNSNRKLLVVNLSDWIPQVKMEAILAKAMQLRGITPIILTYKECRIAQKYFRLFGFNQFVFFDEFLKNWNLKSFIVESQSLLDQVSTIKALLDTKYQNVNVGNHVLSTIVRSLHEGWVETTSSQIKKLLNKMLPEAMQRVVAAKQMLDTIKPEILLFNEKSYSYGPIYDIALSYGLNIIQFVGSHRDDALTFKRYTPETTKIHPVSLSDETWEWVKQMPWSEQHELELMQEMEGHYKTGAWFNRQQLQWNKKLKTKKEVQSQLGLDPHKKTAVIFSHILWDATFFYGDDLFDSYGEWLIETVKAACSNQNLNWIIKLHPANIWKLARDQDENKFTEGILLQKAIGKLPDHIKLMYPDTDINTYSLFNLTDYCLTVRGTIGIEMPCYGIPVFTAGTGRYSGRGFTIDSDSKEDYLTKLSHIQNFPRLTPEQTELAKKHAYALFKLRPFKFETFDIIYKHDRKTFYLDPRIEFRVKSFIDLANAEDLKVFAEWVADSKSLDFLMMKNN